MTEILIDWLICQLSEITHDRDNWKERSFQVRDEWDALQTKHTILRDAFLRLQDMCANLCAYRTELKAKYDTLQGECNSLKTECNELHGLLEFANKHAMVKHAQLVKERDNLRIAYVQLMDGCRDCIMEDVPNGFDI